MAVLGPVVLSLAVLGVAACSAGSADPGRAALLQVAGAEYVHGAVPSASGGPGVVAVQVPITRIEPGTERARVTGRLSADTRVLRLGIPGDRGHWLTTAGLPDPFVPDLLTFDLPLAFAAALPAGPVVVQLQAGDAAGRLGEPSEAVFEAVLPPALLAPLAVRLSWSRPVDLDLHAVEPSGVEIWARNINSYMPPAPGQPPAAPDAWQQGAILDADAFAGCSAAGGGVETIRWPTPADGAYVLRVDTFSLCGASAATWRLEVWSEGRLLRQVEGHSRPSDTRFDHGAGAGVTALRFAWPALQTQVGP
ncbi:MAG: hypothetical protein ACPGUV_00865 [Polyangiales bacterium]